MLAETVAILAGTSPLSWRAATLAGAAGTLVPAVIYAVVGAFGASTTSGTLVFLGVLLLAGVLWLTGLLRRTGQGKP